MNTESLIAQASNALNTGQAFVLYKLPNQNAALVTGTLIAFENEIPQTFNGVVIAPFKGNAYGLASDSVIQSNENNAKAYKTGSSSRAHPVIQENTSAHAYQASVKRAVETMQKTELQKVALSRVHTAALGNAQPLSLFEAAVKQLPNAFHYVLHCAKFGTWIGATPERLIAVANNRVIIDSIAATRKTVEAPVSESEWNEKEKEEQALVTRRIQGVLRDSGFNEVETTARTVLNAGPVSHLHTQLTAPLNQAKLQHLIQALHPTPAVGGEPKANAQRFIEANEKHDRRLYTGYIGPWNSNGSTALYVNIRCMQLFPSQVQLFLGCGITAQSKPLEEWEETNNKARTWLDILAR